ncbi:MAG: restriction endonuclease subunit S [Burkholderiales bacterium]|nr:restriction endonuclease subunit S [Burkholderiales bacterium]
MKADAYVEKGVPVIRGTNITDTRALAGDFVFVSSATADDLRACNVYADDLVFPHRGAIGQVAIVPDDGVDRYMLSTSLMKLTCDKHRVDPKFVFYFFRSELGRHALLQHASTVGTPGIGQPLTSLRSIRLPVPPLREQRAIAHILGTLDDKIDLNRRMNETLEAMARALFKSWFVDFDPVRAKAEGRDPGLPKPLADLFPARLAESEIGEIPAGWEVAPLPAVIEVNPPRALRKGVAAPYLDMANMPTHGHSADDVVYRAFGSGMRFINGDTLVARITPCLENGKTAFVDFLQDGQLGWGSTEYIVFRPKAPLPEEYAYCLARSAEFREFAIQSMTGTSGRQRVPAESLTHFRVAVPPRPIAEAFGRAVKPSFARASAAVRETRTLAAVRDTLLPKLISGELRVSDAEKLTEVTA